MSRAKDPKKEIRERDKELKSYKGTLRDASFLFEDKVLELSLLKRMSNILGYILDLESFYRMFLDILIEETNAENCSFMLMDTETDRLDLKMARGRNDGGTFFDHPRESGVSFSLDEGIAGKVALERKTILVDDTREDTRFEIREPCAPIGSLLCTPLIFQEKVLGVINLSHTQPHVFSQSNQRIMDLLCTFVSSIIGNALDYIKVKDQENFKSMFEGVGIPILLVDPETNKIVDCNKYTEEWLGYNKKELFHTDHIFDIVPHEYREKVECIVNEIVKTNSSKFNEVSFIRKDGSVNIGEINGTMIDYQGKNIVQVTVKDVTGYNQVVNKLKETNEYLDNLIESSLDPIITTDNKGNITRTNKAFLNLLSHRKEEVIGKHMAEFSPIEEGTYRSTTDELVEINEEFFDNIKTFISKLVEEGKIFNWDSYLIRNDKKLIPVEENIVYFCNEKGDRTGAVGIIRDITERRKAEKEIKETKDFLERIIESSKDGIVVTDEKGTIISVNTAIEQMCSFRKEELIGQHTSELVIEDKDVRKKLLVKIAELFEKGYTTYETIHKKKGGSYITVECNTSVIKDINGNSVAGVSIIRDITERKEMEHKLLQSEKLKSLGELAGGVAHDFNNILAAVLGRVQLLKRQFNSPIGKQEKRKSMLDLKAGLEVIERASLDGADTVRRIQEFSRRSVDDKDFTQVDINELIDNALEFTSVRWKNNAESKGIKIMIKKEFSPLNPTLGSSSELREVFTNLINNAIDAMPQGGEIRVKSFMDDNIVVIRIEDTGGGIPKNTKDRIFDPFFTTKGVKSTGLGLSVSYGIINRHHGTITADSVEGEGTTLTLTFPVTKKTGKREVKEEKVIRMKRKQKKARILVIEDEEDIRELLRDILTDDGHDVEIANGGSEGIEIFKKKKFDLVFTDLGMPVMSGWEVAEKVKSINEKVPVALITGWNVKLDESEMNDSGINLVIHKPFKMEQVLNLVQEGMLLRDQLKTV